MSNPLSFKHGVHPPQNKDITSGIATRRMPFTDEIVLPLTQHIGAPAKTLVQAGDHPAAGLDEQKRQEGVDQTGQGAEKHRYRKN